VGEQELREVIAQRAFDLYQNRGETHGRDFDDWLEAERGVLAQLEDKPHSKI
jgi:outer membrane protein TolC